MGEASRGRIPSQRLGPHRSDGTPWSQTPPYATPSGPPPQHPYHAQPPQEPYYAPPPPEQYYAPPAQQPYGYGAPPQEPYGAPPWPYANPPSDGDRYRADLRSGAATARSAGARHAAPMPEDPRLRLSARPTPPMRRKGWLWLLVVPGILPLLVPVYNRIDPIVWGMPFFYWYQLACGLAATMVITFVYLVTKGRG